MRFGRASSPDPVVSWGSPLPMKARRKAGFFCAAACRSLFELVVHVGPTTAPGTFPLHVADTTAEQERHARRILTCSQIESMPASLALVAICGSWPGSRRCQQVLHEAAIDPDHGRAEMAEHGTN